MSTNLDMEKRTDSVRSSLKMEEKQKEDVQVAVLVRDVEVDLPSLDRFARKVTNWITERGLEGHGCVLLSPPILRA